MPNNSNLTQYIPFMGMEGHQLGQQGFDPKYHEDPLMQELMKARAFDQILGAFTPQDGQGGGSNAFLDTLLGNLPDDTETPPVTPETPAQADPVATENPLLSDGGDRGYDSPMSSFGASGQGGGDGYGLYGNPSGFAGGGVLGDGFGGDGGGGGK